jgi:hypothetical protein
VRYAYDDAIGCARLPFGVPQEEEEYEYVSDKQGSGNGAHEPRIEPAVLDQPLGEPTSGKLAEHGQPEHDGGAHDVSGDGCGDGGFCGGHWVKRSEKGHRHGEPIGDSKDPGGVLGCTAVAGGMVATGVDAWMRVAVGFGCGLATL